MAIAGTKLLTRPGYLKYDEIDRTTEFPVRTKPTGKRYAGYLKTNRPVTDYLKYMTHVFAVSHTEAADGVRATIPGSSILAQFGGVGQCTNMSLDQCFNAGKAFPRLGHLWSQEGEGDPVLVPDASLAANGINNEQRHKRYYEGIMDGLPSDYWFFGNYGALRFSYSNETFSVDGGAPNGVQSKFTNMYASQTAARQAFKQYYPTYFDMGMHWHAHLYLRYLPAFGVEHSVLHMLLIGKKAFPERKGSLFFWPPVESVTGGSFSVNHKHGSTTTSPAGSIWMYEHAVMSADSCRNVAFIGYMEVEAVTTFEDGYRHGEDRNVRGNADGQFRFILDEFRPAGGGNGTFPYQPNAPYKFPRQSWTCQTATMLGIDLAMQAVNFLGGSHTSYTSEFCKYRLDGGAWVEVRSDGADVLYARGSDTVSGGVTISGAKPICRLSRGASGKRVVWFVDPDGPMSGKRKLEVMVDGTIYDLGMYDARDLHVQCFSVGSVGGGDTGGGNTGGGNTGGGNNGGGTAPSINQTLTYLTNHYPPGDPTEFSQFLGVVNTGLNEGGNSVRMTIRIGEWIKANGNYARWDQWAALATANNRNAPLLIHILIGFLDNEFPSWLTTDMCQRYHDGTQPPCKTPSLEFWNAWKDGVGYDESNPVFRIEGIARQIILRYSPAEVSWGLSESAEFQYSHRNGSGGIETYSGCEPRADTGFAAYTNNLYTFIPNPASFDINDSFGTNDDRGRRAVRYRTTKLATVKEWGQWITGSSINDMIDCGAYTNSQSVLVGTAEVKRLTTGIPIVKVNAMAQDDWRFITDYLAQLAAQGMVAIDIEGDFSLFNRNLSTVTPNVVGRWVKSYSDNTEIPRTTTNINNVSVYDNFTRALGRGRVRAISLFGVGTHEHQVAEYVRCIHALDGLIGVPIATRGTATNTITASIRKLRKAGNEGAWLSADWNSIGKANLVDFETIEETF
ncbi:hypothetical protein ACO2Q8_07720 [Larkinella sp. VNQ87]|uniref:hypothetical protein n=1 Tax=Larkinella sp. VNQ87 TaxID=3400921 RepID=UPI003C032E08